MVRIIVRYVSIQPETRDQRDKRIRMERERENQARYETDMELVKGIARAQTGEMFASLSPEALARLRGEEYNPNLYKPSKS